MNVERSFSPVSGCEGGPIVGSADFQTKFAAAVEQAGIRHRRHSPDSILQLWSKFADDCARSFQGAIEEYIGSLGIRSVIQEVLQSEDLLKCPEIVAFASSVARIDGVFLGCLDLERRANIPRPSLEDGDAWYWQYLPKYAGESLVNDLRVHYGFESKIR